MSRRIYAKRRHRGGEEEVGQTYKDRLMKLIPAEVIGAYLSASAVVKSGVPGDPRGQYPYLWALLVAGVILTAAYLYRLHKVRSHLQIAASAIAFVVWIFGIGGPFEAFTWYEPFQGALAMTLVTLLLPLLHIDNPREAGDSDELEPTVAGR